MNERQDDGSLAFLQIPRDENSRSFNCDETTQSKSRRPVPVKAYKMAVASWLGWAQHSNSKHLLKSIIKPQYYASIL